MATLHLEIPCDVDVTDEQRDEAKNFLVCALAEVIDKLPAWLERQASVKKMLEGIF